MRNDFDTSEAIAAIFDVGGRAGSEISARSEIAERLHSLSEVMAELILILGFELREELDLYTEVEMIRVRYPVGVEPEESLNTLIGRRERARRERDWETADQLREEIRARGWEIEDNPNYVRIYPAEQQS